MGAGTLAVFEETTQAKTRAKRVWEQISIVGSLDSSAADLMRLIEIHRANRPIEEIRRLPRLNFAVQSTETSDGIRYVLWWPVFEMLRVWRPRDAEKWVEEWICGQELVIAYVPPDAASLLAAISPWIEETRLGNPYVGRSSALRMVVVALQYAVDNVSEMDNSLLVSLHKSLAEHSRKNSIQHSSSQHELKELASTSPDWAIRACVEFLRFARFEPADVSAQRLSVASEPSLSADWLRTEEDAAWNHL